MGTVIISIVAVIVAIVIPIFIANKQNKIALFDKRFKSYEIFQKYDSYLSLIKNNPNGSCIDMLIVVFLDGNKNDFQTGNIIPKIINMSMPIEQMPYLFDDIDKKEVGRIVYNLISLIKSCMENGDLENCKQQYIDSVEKFKAKHYNKILKSLKL